MTIRRFEYEYAFLSAHYPADVTLVDYPDLVFSSSIAAYWALRYPALASELAGLPAPEANRLGMKHQKDDFLETFVSPSTELLTHYMRKATLAKFDQHPALREQLLRTGDRELLNYNTWGDTIWGLVYDENGTTRGWNLLGRVLTQIRHDYGYDRRTPADGQGFEIHHVSEDRG